MEIINKANISIINQENQQLKMKNELLVKAIAQLEIANKKLENESKKKDLIAMQLTKTVAEINLKINKLEVK